MLGYGGVPSAASLTASVPFSLPVWPELLDRELAGHLGCTMPNSMEKQGFSTLIHPKHLIHLPLSSPLCPTHQAKAGVHLRPGITSTASTSKCQLHPGDMARMCPH